MQNYKITNFIPKITNFIHLTGEEKRFAGLLPTFQILHTQIKKLKLRNIAKKDEKGENTPKFFKLVSETAKIQTHV